MSQTAYLEDKLARSDPDFLLTRSFSPAAMRAPLTALFALRAELRGLRHMTEPEVAAAKIAWWQQEWQRLVDARPSHPVTQALFTAGARPLAQSLDVALAATSGMVSGYALERIEDLSRLAQGLSQPFGQLEHAFAPQCMNPALLWQRIETVALVEEIPSLLALGRAPLPLEINATVQQTPSQLANGGARVAMQVLAQRILDQQDWPSGPAVVGIHAMVYLSLQHSKLKSFARRGVAAHPLRRLLAAWRGARRQNRIDRR